ncbi:MAG: hypothetical protein IJ747_00445 [Lachnospiraceae bacterium]|nr:hypothetical protein [Lachnospiraceae bacterium]
MALGDISRYSAEGYGFYTEKDAALAENERHKVEYLEARLDYKNPEGILRFYNKVIEERVFKTPVGFYFLMNLQQFLKKQPGIAEDSIADIPMYVTFDSEFRDQASPARNRIRVQEKKPEPKRSTLLPISLIINAGLIVAVIAMFAIALKADQPNILNYEKALTNRYSNWEQQLTERENAVRQRERELQLTGE